MTNPTLPSRQFTIRELLVVTTLAAVALGAGRAFGGDIGLFEIVLAGNMALSILLAALLPAWPFAWIMGLCFCVFSSWLFLPGAMLEWSLGAASFGALYAFLGAPLLFVCRTRTRRWPWVLAAFGCVYSAVAFTPADPVSALILMGELSLVFAGAAAWQMSRQRCADTDAD